MDLPYDGPNPHDSTDAPRARALDVDLLEALRGGDGQAGKRLLDRYSDPIVGFFKKKARKDAEDLAHTTFMRMLEGRDRVRASGAFRAYALGIARNVLREHARALARGRNVDPEVEAIEQLAPDRARWSANERSTGYCSRVCASYPWVIKQSSSSSIGRAWTAMR